MKIDPSEGFLRGGMLPVLLVQSAGHALHVFINGQLSGAIQLTAFKQLKSLTQCINYVFVDAFSITGTAYGSLEKPHLTFRAGINLKAGANKIALLSITVGLQV